MASTTDKDDDKELYNSNLDVSISPLLSAPCYQILFVLCMPLIFAGMPISQTSALSLLKCAFKLPHLQETYYSNGCIGRISHLEKGSP